MLPPQTARARRRACPLPRVCALALLAAGLGLACAPTGGPRPPAWPRDAQGRHLVTFRLRPPAPCERVFLAGDFSGWDPQGIAMTDADGDGVFEVTVPLAPGRHLYKFVLDGQRWVADPENPVTDGSEYGNSVLFVGVEPSEAVEGSTWLPAAQQITPTPRADPNAHFALRDEGFDEVFVSGDFNGWTGQLDQMALDVAAGRWTLSVRLPEPVWSAYRFVARRGDAWQSFQDPACRLITFDGHPVDSVLRSPGAPRGAVVVASARLTASTSSVESRPIYVWVPPGFDAARGQHYPVLYMLDGQNVFDDPVNPFGHGGWHVNTVAEALLRAGRIEPLLIVAVPNAHARMVEYGLWEDAADTATHPHVRYLLDDVIPLVNADFPTRTGPAHTAVMGSSMGGLAALHLAYTHPEVFGAAACLSPAFMIADGRGHTLAEVISAEGKRPVRVYIDCGTAGLEAALLPSARAMRDLLLASGWTLGEDLVWHEAPGAEHSERAWRARVDRPLEFLFGARR